LTAAAQNPVRVVGRYALYGELASGGMATVHIGRLLGPVGFARTIAIKRLHPQYAKDPEFVSMFLDEARLAARIQHPNVCDARRRRHAG
jgi:serine/threonine protein kinase